MLHILLTEALPKTLLSRSRAVYMYVDARGRERTSARRLRTTSSFSTNRWLFSNTAAVLGARKAMPLVATPQW